MTPVIRSHPDGSALVLELDDPRALRAGQLVELRLADGTRCEATVAYVGEASVRVEGVRVARVPLREVST